MDKTKVARRDLLSQKRLSAMDLPGMVADLNGRGKPRGLVLYFGDLVGSKI